MLRGLPPDGFATDFKRTLDEVNDKKLNEITESLQFDIDKVNNYFTCLENRVKSLELEKPMNAYVEKILTSHALLIERNEAYSRRNNVQIFGIPEVPDDNPESLVLDLFKQKLHVECQKQDLERVHRVGVQTLNNEQYSKQWFG